ncbi:MAG: hypothetical protein JOY93_03715 [Acidobacteriales bacterium]|nr:hypothetical protein [Terriglobales bacterium]
MAKPRWYLIPARVVLVTFLMTLLSFAVSLLLGILGIWVGARLRGVPPQITVAYRYIALPSAIFVGAVVLVAASAMEIRAYRQNTTLAEIERDS